MFDPAISGSSNAIELSAGRARMGFIAIQTQQARGSKPLSSGTPAWAPSRCFPMGIARMSIGTIATPPFDG
jgi:hypothetical protein